MFDIDRKLQEAALIAALPPLLLCASHMQNKAVQPKWPGRPSHEWAMTVEPLLSHLSHPSIHVDVLFSSQHSGTGWGVLPHTLLLEKSGEDEGVGFQSTHHWETPPPSNRWIINYFYITCTSGWIHPPIQQSGLYKLKMASRLVAESLFSPENATFELLLHETLKPEPKIQTVVLFNILNDIDCSH